MSLYHGINGRTEVCRIFYVSQHVTPLQTHSIHMVSTGTASIVLVWFSYRKRRRVCCAVEGRLRPYIASTTDERRICERWIWLRYAVFLFGVADDLNCASNFKCVILFLKKRSCLWWMKILKHRCSCRLSIIGSALRLLAHWSKNSAFKFYAV